MEIRNETAEDIQVIHRLTADAFAPKAFSDGTEPDIIDKLRVDGDLTLSLVVIIDERVVGHVAFSPVTIGVDTDGWYGLGPIAVWPDLQRSGIGTALINEGFEKLRTLQASGCALIGDPKYYSRFGFISDGNVHYTGVPDSHVQHISFAAAKPKGQLIFPPAFGD